MGRYGGEGEGINQTARLVTWKLSHKIYYEYRIFFPERTHFIRFICMYNLNIILVHNYMLMNLTITLIPLAYWNTCWSVLLYGRVLQAIVQLITEAEIR